jgi:hypothetical protein
MPNSVAFKGIESAQSSLQLPKMSQIMSLVREYGGLLSMHVKPRYDAPPVDLNPFKRYSFQNPSCV